MTALGGDLDLNRLLAQLSEERAKKYTDKALAVAKLRRYPTGNFRGLMGRLVSAAIYEPAGRSWLVAGFMDYDKPSVVRRNMCSWGLA